MPMAEPLAAAARPSERREDRSPEPGARPSRKAPPRRTGRRDVRERKTGAAPSLVASLSGWGGGQRGGLGRRAE